MSKLKALLDKRELFNRYLSLENASLSGFHFSSLAAWSSFFDFTFEEINSRLCVFAQHESGSFLYLPPLGGKIEESTLDLCFEKMGAQSISRRVGRVENISQEQALRLKEKDVECIFKSNEYLYRKDDIVGLQGNAYKSQRHDINHLLKNSVPFYQEYTLGFLKDCLDLHYRWALNRKAHHQDVLYQMMIDDSAKAHAVILEHYKELGLKGRVVIVDKKVVAYSFGYPLNESTFCVLLEVTDLNIAGLSAFIFQRFCADDCWRQYTQINAMDDFGMPDVAKAKGAYHPVALIPSYTIYPRRNEHHGN